MEVNNKYVFISYSSNDKEAADSIREILHNLNLSCWMAPYSIKPGEDYAEALFNAIEKCACVVLLLSEASQNSPHVLREISLSVSNNKPIIPIQSSNIMLLGNIKYYIGVHQIVTIPTLQKDSPEFEPVLKHIENILKTGLFHRNLTVNQEFTQILNQLYNSAVIFRNSINNNESNRVNNNINSMMCYMNKLFYLSERCKYNHADITDKANTILGELETFINLFNTYLKLSSKQSADANNISNLAGKAFANCINLIVMQLDECQTTESLKADKIEENNLTTTEDYDINFEFQSLLKKIYDASVDYRISINYDDKANIYKASADLEKYVRELSIFEERYQYHKLTIIEKAKEITESFEEYGKFYNKFTASRDNDSEESKYYAEKAQNAFSFCVDLMIRQLK